MNNYKDTIIKGITKELRTTARNLETGQVEWVVAAAHLRQYAADLDKLANELEVKAYMSVARCPFFADSICQMP